MINCRYFLEYNLNSLIPGSPLEGKVIIDAANKILKRFHPDYHGPALSRYWFRAFIKRRKGIVCIKSLNVSIASTSVTELQIRQWFAKIENYLRQELSTVPIAQLR